jgi:hypothetical protein
MTLTFRKNVIITCFMLVNFCISGKTQQNGVLPNPPNEPASMKQDDNKIILSYEGKIILKFQITSPSQFTVNEIKQAGRRLVLLVRLLEQDHRRQHQACGRHYFKGACPVWIRIPPDG